MKLNTSKFPNFEYPQMQLTAFEPIANLSTHTYAHFSRVFQDMQTPMLQVHLTDWNPSNPSFMLSVPRQNQPPVKIQGFVAMGCSKKSRIQITTKKNHHKIVFFRQFHLMPGAKPKLHRNIGHYHNGTHLVKDSDHKMC